MEKIWLKNYPEGVPAEINPDSYPSLIEIFEEACQNYSSKPAFANMGKIISFTELEEQTRYFAAFLQSELQLKKGDSLAIMLPNLLQYPIALFGALRAGLSVVNINPLFTHREVEHQLQDTGAKAILVVENFAHTVEQTYKNTNLKHIILTEIGDCLGFPKSQIVNFVVRYIKKMVPAVRIPGALRFKDCLKKGKTAHFQKPTLTGEDIAFLQYTGGTTGRPKSAVLTHRNMVANLEQASAWLKPVVKLGDEIIITALPLYHIFSLTANCLAFLRAGGLNVLITNPKDMKGFVKEIRKYPFTAITGVNTLFNGLLHQPEFKKLDFSHLHITLGGGMAVQRAVAESWQQVTGTALVEAYGLTETSPAVTMNPLDLKAYNGTIGLPVPSTDVSIRDDDDNELPIGTPGELCVKGPQVMREYWNRPEETKITLIDGWLHTGDIATIDKDGYVRIVDRKKDMILVSGFNVFPAEIEDVIAMLNGIREVAVVGVIRHGHEVVKAFIVRKDPNLTKEKILQYCRAELTPYKVPKEIEFRDELPKSNVGKILRRVLKEAS